MEIIKGQVHKVGHDIDTDLIIPARFLNDISDESLARNCMNDVIQDFNAKVKFGDVLVAGKNFGCGSSREHAPIAIKASGISCVIAESFARIFYRNAINIGLPIIVSEAAAREIAYGDNLEVDIKDGIVINHTQNKRYEVEQLPPFILEIMAAGDLISYTRKKVMAND
ncbi:MAG: 3-isopropylmalate dehydratase small subunit [Clostridia bacterium]|nr:3-isopropylmalate dehydratase small subunit [Clostridia bacterium]